MRIENFCEWLNSSAVPLILIGMIFVVGLACKVAFLDAELTVTDIVIGAIAIVFDAAVFLTWLICNCVRNSQSEKRCMRR